MGISNCRQWVILIVFEHKTLPQWLKDAVGQARRYAGPSQLGLAALHEAGQRADGDLVVLTLADFRAWFGGDTRDGEAA